MLGMLNQFIGYLILSASIILLIGAFILANYICKEER